MGKCTDVFQKMKTDPDREWLATDFKEFGPGGIGAALWSINQHGLTTRSKAANGRLTNLLTEKGRNWEGEVMYRGSPRKPK